MRKIVTAFFLIALSLQTSTVHAGAGAVGAAEANMALNITGQALAATYVGQNIGCCYGCKSHRRYTSCVKVAAGLAQAVLLRKQFSQAKDVRNTFGLDEFTGFKPDDMGFCLDPSTGCSQDSLDSSIMSTPLGPALKSGDPEQLNKAMSDIEKLNTKTIKDLEAQGYSVDLDKGTVTGPDGKTQSLNDGMSLPSSLESAMQSRAAAIDKNIANAGNTDGRGLASEGADGAKLKSANGSAQNATNFKNEFLDDDLGSRNSNLDGRFNKRKKTKDELLAAMADKDQSGSVGMAGDDIFKMIQRRYDKKKKSSEFIVQQ